MNRLLLVSIAAGLMSAAAAAQERASSDAIPPVQAPPAMDDPDAAPATPPVAAHSQMKTDPKVKTIPLGNSDAEAKAAADDAQRRAATPVSLLPPEPETKLDSPGLPPEVQKAAEATELPVVTVRQEGTDTIEEYRKHGKLFMKRIVPKEGPPRYYVDSTGHGQFAPVPGSGLSGRVDPVQYKLYEW